ncbi:MAG: hypothetical protein M3R50_11995 [Bacteroidota bacterium]|nr:hypothetical protein [Bacteroidota bacterium]
MVEEKGIYSIEKFLVSRRLMYWQVYLHKTVLCAEKMLINIIRRARAVKATAPSKELNIFLHTEFNKQEVEMHLNDFCRLDDYDVLSAIKIWTSHPDKVLSFLCEGIVNRKLLKIKYSGTKIDKEDVIKKIELTTEYFKISEQEAAYLVFTGETENRTYSNDDEHINILFKDGSIKDISAVDNALINQTLFGTVKKFYICFPKVELI